MNLLFIGMTLSVVGKVMIALAVVAAHTELAREHRVDAKVVRSFHKEKIFTLVGIALIVAGYFAEVYFFGGFSVFATCSGSSCAASLGALLTQ